MLFSCYICGAGGTCCSSVSTNNFLAGNNTEFFYLKDPSPRQKVTLEQFQPPSSGTVESVSRVEVVENGGMVVCKMVGKETTREIMFYDIASLLGSSCLFLSAVQVYKYNTFPTLRDPWLITHNFTFPLSCP